MIPASINIELDDQEIDEVEQDARYYASDFNDYGCAYVFFYDAMLQSKIQSYEPH